MRFPSTSRHGEASQSRRLLPIYIAAGATFAAIAARSFLIPLRASELGGNRFQIGLLFSIVTLSAALLSLPAGVLADRLGRRRVLVISVIAGAGSQVGIAFSHTIELYFLWQALAGIGGAASQAALFAAVADEAHGPRLGRAMGWITLSMQVGFLGGPAIAGTSLRFLSLEADILAMTLLYGVVLVMAVVGVRGGPGLRAGPPRLAADLRQLAASSGFGTVTLALLAVTLLWGTLQGFLTIFAKESLQLPGVEIGYLLALQAFANGLSRLPAGWLVDRIQPRPWLYGGAIAVFAVSLSVLPHTHGFLVPALVLMASVPFVAVAYVSLSVAFTNLATPESRGVAMGLYGAVLFFGLGAGPAAFGPIMQASGYIAGFTACAIVAVVLTVLALAAPAVLRATRTSATAVISPPTPRT